MCGYLIANFRMTPDAIVKHLDILKRDLFGFCSGFKSVVMQTLGFRRGQYRR